MIVTPVVLFHVLTAVPLAPAAAPPFSEAIEEVRCGFEPEQDRDFDGLPDDWTRRRGDNLPPYVEYVIDPECSHGAGQSLRCGANGGGAAFYSPPRRIDPHHSYVFRAFIRTQELASDAALVSVSLLDHKRQRRQRFLTRPVGGTHNDWVCVTIGPIDPQPDVRFVVFGCHLVPGPRPDVTGAAWFDDLWLGRLPRLSIGSNFLAQFVEGSAPVQVEATVSGLDVGHEYRLNLMMWDDAGRVVEQATFALAADPPDATDAEDEPVIRPRTQTWTVPELTSGYYRVVAALVRDGTVVLERETSLAVMSLIRPTSSGEFGWSIPRGLHDLPPERLAELAAQGGVNWLKVPLWDAADAEPAESAQLADALNRLSQRGVTVVGLLSDPPLSVRHRLGTDWTGAGEIFSLPPAIWTPSTDPVLARYSTVVRHWQLGADGDTSFVGLPRMAETLATVKREFDRIGRNTSVGIHWPADRAPGDGERWPRGFLSLTGVSAPASNPASGGEGAARTFGLPTWRVIQPRPLSEGSTELVSSDLVLQMVAAKAAGAQAIFIGDAFSPESGLLKPDGSPTPLFLPWRTAAVALRGTEYVGSFQLPNGSRNAVFCRAGEVVIVVWSDVECDEEFYLGEAGRVSLVDLSGARSQPAINPRTAAQVVRVGPVPVILRGCSEPVARWRMATRFERGRLQSATGQHEDALILRNTFPQGVTGEATLQVPPDWEIEPRMHQFSLAPGEELRLPMLISLPPYATLGPERLAVEFNLDADRKHRFRVEMAYQVGLGDVLLDVVDRKLPDGRLEIEQVVINNTAPAETLNFQCSLFIPGRKRQTAQVTKLTLGKGTKFYYLQDADELRGKELWLRCEQVDGRRVLNYRWVVGRDWE